ncbi:MAG: hypothetical protein ACK52I_17425 [Pseudomonadota bacterium]
MPAGADGRCHRDLAQDGQPRVGPTCRSLMRRVACITPAAVSVPSDRGLASGGQDGGCGQVGLD